MKTYEIVIKPLSGFGTPLKGDTIFGHFCWQIAHDEKLTGKSLDALLVNYPTKPFAVFSSAYPKFYIGDNHCYAFKTPSLPPDELFTFPEDEDIKQRIEKRKEYKAKRWMILEKNKRPLSIKKLKFLSDEALFEDIKATISEDARRRTKRAELRNVIVPFSQFHNKINRISGTTGMEGFAPFSMDQQVFLPESELSIFVGIDETMITVEQIHAGLERIGLTGFGKDASTGLGRFEILGDNEIDLATMGCDSPNACYTLSPSVPERDTFSDMFFTPFTRFGRHGDVLAKSANPFKNPVIMANEGGIFKPKNEEVFRKPYIGTAVTNISKALPKSVAQGYSLYIPVNVEV
ncbi:MAG: hypothetical protein B6D34_11180 [Candidatus Brocadia sp. UTAMX1]|jgi:CRISPR-associated protein Csm4|nr:MAG: hypothetical protein B6D34_11180 [Candidatus Brocadia sp. UTAMX1]